MLHNIEVSFDFVFSHIHSYCGVHAAPKLQAGTPFKPKQAVHKPQCISTKF